MQKPENIVMDTPTSTAYCKTKGWGIIKFFA